MFFPNYIHFIASFSCSGSILSRKMRLRRSSKLMFFDPYTLTITPTASGVASGHLYLDDETSWAHEALAAYSYRTFSYDAATGRLSCTKAVEAGGRASSGTYEPVNTVERIELAGQPAAPKRVTVTGAGIDGVKELTFFYDSANKVVTVKKPDVRVAADWVVAFEF